MPLLTASRPLFSGRTGLANASTASATSNAWRAAGTSSSRGKRMREIGNAATPISATVCNQQREREGETEKTQADRQTDRQNRYEVCRL